MDRAGNLPAKNNSNMSSANVSIILIFNVSTVIVPLRSIGTSSTSSSSSKVIVVTQELRDGKVVSSSATTA